MAILAGLLALAACGDSFPDYRYRMTVEVETPEGLKTGSSVIEVRTKQVATILDSSGKTFKSELSGEAEAVDVAPGQTLFALLSKPDNADYAKGVAFSALKPVRTSGGDLEGYRQHLTEMTKVEGVHELPREHWPFMVRFLDIKDPKSVVEVKPDALSDAFGPGVRLRRVTIEITDDDVTTGLEQKLPWLAEYRGRKFSGDRFHKVQSEDLTAHLSAGSFSTEIRR